MIPRDKFIPAHLKNLLTQKENLQLDFKCQISGYSRIARTLSAFSNTRGGNLLIGIRDDGSVAGINPAEELFMIRTASRLWSSPVVLFTSREWKMEGKKLLEVTIPEGASKPYLAKNEEQRWRAYLRFHDENILAGRIWVQAMKRRSGLKDTRLTVGEDEKLLLRFLEDHPDIGLPEFRNLAGISRHAAESIFIDLLSVKVLDIVFSGNMIRYRLSDQFLNLSGEV